MSFNQSAYLFLPMPIMSPFSEVTGRNERLCCGLKNTDGLNQKGNILWCVCIHLKFRMLFFIGELQAQLVVLEINVETNI